MRRKFGNVLLIALGIGVTIYLLVSSIMDLTNQRDLKTVRLYAAVDLLKVEHSINGLIPIGKDYYYIGYEENSQNLYLIKGSKNWLKKNFNSEYEALDANGLQITAITRRVHDYETSDALRSYAGDVSEYLFPLGMDHVLDLNYKAKAVEKLLLFVYIIALLVVGYFVILGKTSNKPVVVKIWLVGVLICLGLLIGVLR